MAPEAVGSLDAEKVFDWVEWAYLLAGKFRFGPKLLAWITRHLFKLTNELCSKSFPLSSATRLMTTHYFNGIHRINMYGNRVFLYADDLFLYIWDGVMCAPDIVNMLSRFHIFSGYKWNWWKIECFPVDKLLPFRVRILSIRESTSPVQYQVVTTANQHFWLS